jgi:hypothetical protein
MELLARHFEDGAGEVYHGCLPLCASARQRIEAKHSVKRSAITLASRFGRAPKQVLAERPRSRRPVEEGNSRAPHALICDLMS